MSYDENITYLLTVLKLYSYCKYPPTEKRMVYVKYVSILIFNKFNKSFKFIKNVINNL